MSILWVPLAAMAGGVVGSIAHELVHAVVATLVGEIVAIGWAGGIGGGPYVDFRAATRWRAELVRKAPVVVGLVAAVALALSFDGVTLPWVFAAGAVAGLLWASPEDLFIERAEASAGT